MGASKSYMLMNCRVETNKVLDGMEVTFFSLYRLSLMINFLFCVMCLYSLLFNAAFRNEKR